MGSRRSAAACSWQHAPLPARSTGPVVVAARWIGRAGRAIWAMLSAPLPALLRAVGRELARAGRAIAAAARPVGRAISVTARKLAAVARRVGAQLVVGRSGRPAGRRRVARRIGRIATAAFAPLAAWEHRARPAARLGRWTIA